MLQEAQRKALIDRVQKTLESGRAIGVMGWRKNQHTTFTENLPIKKVRFYEMGKPPTDVENIGLMLLARYLGHQDSKRIPPSILYNITLETKEVINIFESCRDLLVVRSPVSAVQSPNQGLEQKLEIKPDPPKDLSLEVYELLTQPSPSRSTAMSNDMQSFTKAFCFEANGNKQHKGCVGRNVLARMRKEHGIQQTATQLVATGWLEGHVSEGLDRTGWYKPGPKMLAIDAQKDAVRSPPEDSYQYAQWLVAQEPDLLKKQADIQQQLHQVALAKKAIEELNALRAIPKA